MITRNRPETHQHIHHGYGIESHTTGNPDTGMTIRITDAVMFVPHGWRYPEPNTYTDPEQADIHSRALVSRAMAQAADMGMSAVATHRDRVTVLRLAYRARRHYPQGYATPAIHKSQVRTLHRSTREYLDMPIEWADSAEPVTVTLRGSQTRTYVVQAKLLPHHYGAVAIAMAHHTSTTGETNIVVIPENTYQGEPPKGWEVIDTRPGVDGTPGVPTAN